MKNNNFNPLLFIVIGTLIWCKSYSSINFTKKINWKPITQENISDHTQSFLNFEDCNYDNNFFPLPIYDTLIPISQINHDFEININLLETSPLNQSELNILNKLDEIPILESVIIQQNIISSNQKYYLSIKILPFTSKSGTAHKINHFEIQVNSIQNPSTIKNKTATINKSTQIINGTWHKIAITTSGIYQITYEELLSNKVIKGTTASNSIAILGNEGKMNPYLNAITRPDTLNNIVVHLIDGGDGELNPGDYILFYAQNSDEQTYNTTDDAFYFNKNDFTDTSYIFVGVNPTYQKKINTQSNNNFSISTNQGNGVYHHEKEYLNYIRSGRQWVGESFLNQNPITFDVNLSGIIPSQPIKIFFSAAVRSRANLSNNSIEILSNNELINTINYPPVSAIYYNDFVRYNDQKFTFNSNTPLIQLSFKYAFPDQNSNAWLNSYTLNYQNNWHYTQNQLWITNSTYYSSNANIQHQIYAPNLNSTLTIWDISNFYQPQLLSYQYTNDTLSFIGTYNEIKQYIVADETNYKKGIWLNKIQFKNLKHKGTPEVLILTHPNFTSFANELAKIHTDEDQFKCLVVETPDIYNEFSSGRKEAPGIRDYIRHLYKNPQPDTLKYIILLGDASQDPKQINSSHPNHIPVYQSLNSTRLINSFASDEFYSMMDEHEGDFATGDAMDIPIGRIPVKNTQEARQCIEKIKAYYNFNKDPQNNSKGNWRNLIHFVADDGDAYEHMNQAEQLSKLVDTTIQNLNINKAYLDTYPKVRTVTKNQVLGAEEKIQSFFNDGGLIINYTGHGGEYGWSNNRVLTVADILKMRNNRGYPLVVTATCEFSRFDDPNASSAGEYLFLQDQGGAIALFTTTRLVFSIPNFRLNRTFYNVLNSYKNEENIRLGDLFMKTKIQNNGGTNDRNFTLLGDPVIKLAFPKQGITNTSIQINQNITDTLQALSKFTLAGTVPNNFNGSIDVSVYDKRFTRLSLDNDGIGRKFEFFLQNTQLSLGRTTVTDGKFNVNMMLPINTLSHYDFGKITYYAWNNTEDYSGYFRDVVIGGRDSSILNDHTGPEIQVWLNDSAFNFGDPVTPEPVLIATLNDSSGINLNSADISSYILLTLNENKNTEYILNPYFAPKKDSYTSGNIQFQLKDIKEGKHRLSLKANDNFNNPNDAYTEFYIADNIELAIKNLINYPNPFTTHTGFYFETNQPAEMDILIKIYTISGRMIKTIRYNNLNSGRLVGPVNWDGRDDFGDKIGRGTYIYQLSIEHDGKFYHEMNKLVILN